MVRVIALIALSAIPAAAAVNLTLNGVWKATVDQAWYCGEPAPVAMEEFSFEILDAPVLTFGVQSFDYNAANVVAAVTIRVREQGSHPKTVISGLLVGELVKDTRIGSGPTAKAVGLALKGYIVSREDYGAWKQKKKQVARPRDAGEVELEVSGSFLLYTLTGIVRSNEGCLYEQPLSTKATELTGNFGRNVSSKWSAHVTLVQK
jgi:hypothetical protein